MLRRHEVHVFPCPVVNYVVVRKWRAKSKFSGKFASTWYVQPGIVVRLNARVRPVAAISRVKNEYGSNKVGLTPIIMSAFKAWSTYGLLVSVNGLIKDRKGYRVR